MRTLITFSFLFLSLICMAQEGMIKKQIGQIHDTLDYQWSMTGGQLNLKPVGSKHEALAKYLSFTLSRTETDLIISGQLKDTLLTDRMSFFIESQLILGNTISISPNLQNATPDFFMDQQKTFELRFFDFFIEHPEWVQSDESVQLVIQAKVFKKLFTSKPKLGLKKIWPDLAGIAIGSGFILHSYLLHEDAKEIYNNDYKSQVFRRPAEPAYEEAERIRKNANASSLIGIGITTISVVDLTLKYIKHRKRVRAYKQDQGIGLQIPSYNFINGSVYTGFSLNLRF